MILLAIIFVITFIWGEVEETEQAPKAIRHTKPLLKPEEIIVQRVSIVGSEDFADMNYMFALVGDIAVDLDDNLYVLDIRNNKVSAYTPEGKFIRSYGKGTGQGPGEIQKADHLDVDDRSCVYVSDAQKRVIHVFDEHNEVINTIRTRNFAMPGSDLSIYGHKLLCVGIDFTILRGLDTGIFQLYSLPEGKYLSSVGEYGKIGILKHKDDHDAWFSEATPQICFDDARNRLVVSHGHDYWIEVWSLDGILLQSFGRKTSGRILSFGRKGIDQFYILQDASFGLTVLPDGKILNVVRHIDKNEDEMSISFYFDLFSKDGEVFSRGNPRRSVWPN